MKLSPIYKQLTSYNDYLSRKAVTNIVYYVKKLVWDFLDAFAKLRKATISFVIPVGPSICPHGTNRLSLDGFSLNLVFECFSKKKNCQENSSLVKIGQE